MCRSTAVTAVGSVGFTALGHPGGNTEYFERHRDPLGGHDRPTPAVYGDAPMRRSGSTVPVGAWAVSPGSGSGAEDQRGEQDA